MTVILALAALLRFYALPQRGFIYWDEGKYALEGLRLQAALHGLLGSGGAVIAGKAVGTAKPTHALLIAMSYALFGVHDYAPLFLNAACSVAQVAVVYLIARRLFDTPTALIAAAFLAVSEYDVIYARSALSESDANLILLAGVLLWTFQHVPIDQSASPWRWLPLAGLLMGLSFTTNYRLIVYVATIVAFDLIWAWRPGTPPKAWVSLPVGSKPLLPRPDPDVRGSVDDDRTPPAGYALGDHSVGSGSFQAAARRLPPWALGLVTAPLAWQLVDLVARARGLVMFRSELTGGPSWYLGQALYQLHEGKQSALHFSPGPYLHWYVLRAGWPMFILLLAGIALALWRHAFPWLAMAVPVVVPYLIYVFAPFIVPRNLDAALPFAAVLSAAVLLSIGEWMWKTRSFVPARNPLTPQLLVAIILIGIGAAMSWRLTGERSGYAQAASYVDRHDRGRAVVSSEIMAFYLRGSGAHCLAPELLNHVDRLSADVRAGYRYAVLDHFSWKLARLVRSRMPRVARFPVEGDPSLGENLIESEHYPPSRGYRLEHVDVFRLDPARLPPPGQTSADVCNRERV